MGPKMRSGGTGEGLRAEAVALAGPVERTLRRSGDWTRRHPDGAVLAVGGGELHVLWSGALVGLGLELTSPEVREVLSTRLGAQPVSTTEDRWELWAGDGRGAVHVDEDRIVMRCLGEVQRDVACLMLGQSAVLDRHSARADALVTQALAVSKALLSKGRWRRRRELVHLVAAANVQRLRAVEGLYLVDRPECTWDDPAANALYESMFEALDLGDRQRAVERRLDAVQQAIEVALEVQSQDHGSFLEVVIIALIAFEIVFLMVVELG